VSGTVDGGTAVFNYGTPVTLTATPAASSTATPVVWAGCDSVNGSNQCIVNMTAIKNVTATFTINSYTVSTSAGAGGSISPTSRLVTHGSTTTFTVTANAGYIIGSVTGCGGSLAGSTYTTGVITGICTVSATFMADQSLTVTKAGTGVGTVSSSPLPLSGSVDGGTAVFNYGTSVTLTAGASTGSAFTGWTGACSGTGTCIVTMDAAKSVTATFTLSPYTLTVTKTGTAASISTVTTSTGTLGWSGNTGTAAYTYNTSVTLTAAAASGSKFMGWSGEGCSGTGTCTVTMTAARNVSADFMLDQTITVTKNGSGTISSLPAPVSGDVNAGSATFNYNTPVTLTATAQSGWTFSSWSGCDSVNGPLCSVTMTSAKSVTATFTSNTYTLTVTKAGTGTGTISSNPLPVSGDVNTGSATFSWNELVTLSALPDVSSTFTGWSGEGCSGTGPCVVTMSVARSVTATFTIKSFTLNFVPGSGGSLTGTTTQTVTYGNSATAVTAVPTTPGYHFVNWTGTNGFVTTTANPLTVTNVTASQNITANFAIDTFTLNFAAGSGGTLSGTTPQTISYGGSSSVVTALPNTGYHFVNWTGTNGFVTTTANPLTVTNVTASQNITANFAIDTFTLNFAAGSGGTLSGTTPQTISYGGSSSAVTALPNTGYHFVNWTGTGGFVTTTANPLTVTNVTASQNITANFAVDTFTIIASSGIGGSISPSGTVTVNYGADQTFNIVPDVDYSIADVLVDSVSIGPQATFTFTNVTTDHMITATFQTP
jgi:uncharacterized repeat protein (TIGR02543 family)